MRKFNDVIYLKDRIQSCNYYMNIIISIFNIAKEKGRTVKMKNGNS